MGNFKETSDSLPKSISKATKEPPICDVEKVVGRGAVCRFIEFELIKMASLISVGNNLNNQQIEFIATQMVEMFPNESLADFKLCFERGCIGQYGEIYRMDGIVLRKWMEQYLDEKYQVIESELMKQKDDEYKKHTPETGKDWHQVWLDAIAKNGKKEPELDDAYYQKYGQKNPVRESKTSGYKYFTVSNVQVIALTQEHANELVQLMIDKGELDIEKFNG